MARFTAAVLLVSVCFMQALASEDSQFWRCRNGLMIQSIYRCDGAFDCKDGSDEWREECGTKCSPEQFSCDKSRCIDDEYVCDGFPDCTDGEDEDSELCDIEPTESPDYGICPSAEFQCLDGSRCLSKRYVCDGSEECKDGSDEQDCDNTEIDIDPEPTAPATAKPILKIPKKCAKKPFLTKCKAYWSVLAMKLKEKLVRKCMKKPESKRCLKYAGMLAFREPPSPKKKRNKNKSKMLKKCKKNPKRKGCDGILNGLN